MALRVYAFLFLVVAACDLGHFQNIVTPYENFYVTGYRQSMLQKFRDETLKRWLVFEKEREEEKEPDYRIMPLDADSDLPEMTMRKRQNKYAFSFIPNVYHPRGWTPYKPSRVKSHRLYDMPQTDCPGGEEMLACPSSDKKGRYRCIEDRSLCDGFWDCPNGDDEDQYACMFFKTSRKQMNLVANAVLKFYREA